MPHVSEFHALPHDRHDRLVVAALAAGDLAGTDRDHARTLLAACPDCAALHTDLLAIARATAALPAAARSRDFRISPEQAARLRPGGWRRLVAAFASPRLAITKPLGVGLTTLGLAGILVSNVGVPLGMGAGASASEAPNRITTTETTQDLLASHDGASFGAEASAGAPAVAASANPVANGGPGASPDLEGTTNQAPGDGDPAPLEARDASLPTGPTVAPLTGLSIGAVLIGLALLLARRVGRRVSGS